MKDATTGQDIGYVNLSGNLEAMAIQLLKHWKKQGIKNLIASLHGYSSLEGISKNSNFPLFRRGIKGEAKQKNQFLEVPFI